MGSSAVYPGTFDPPTNGHFDIVRRSLRIFEKVTLAISVNPQKSPLFSYDERKEFFTRGFNDIPNLEVAAFDRQLLVDFVQSIGADVIIRGLRAVSDFDYEFQMTLMNRRLNNDLETVFLMPSEQYSFISSSLVKEVVSLGGDVSELVPPSVKGALNQKFKR